MSNPLKAVGKVFKKAVQVVKRILPIVIAAAAIYVSYGLATGQILGTVAAGGGTGVIGGTGAGTAGGAVAPATTVAAGAGAGGGAGIPATLPGAGVLSGATKTVAPAALKIAGDSAAAGGPFSQFLGAAGKAVSGLASGAKAAGGFLAENPTLAFGAVQGIGSALGGVAEGRARQKELDFEKDKYNKGFSGSIDSSYESQRSDEPQESESVARAARTPTREEYNPSRTEFLPRQRV